MTDNTKITSELTIQKRGSSLTVTITPIARIMKLDEGQKIKVTVERVE